MLKTKVVSPISEEEKKEAYRMFQMIGDYQEDVFRFKIKTAEEFEEKFRAIIDEHPDFVNNPLPDDMYTPLSIAVFYGCEPALRVLFQAGASDYQRGAPKFSRTPKHSVWDAIQPGHTDIVRPLLFFLSGKKLSSDPSGRSKEYDEFFESNEKWEIAENNPVFRQALLVIAGKYGSKTDRERAIREGFVVEEKIEEKTPDRPPYVPRALSLRILSCVIALPLGIIGFSIAVFLRILTKRAWDAMVDNLYTYQSFLYGAPYSRPIRMSHTSLNISSFVPRAQFDAEDKDIETVSISTDELMEERRASPSLPYANV